MNTAVLRSNLQQHVAPCNELLLICIKKQAPLRYSDHSSRIWCFYNETLNEQQVLLYCHTSSAEAEHVHGFEGPTQE